MSRLRASSAPMPRGPQVEQRLRVQLPDRRAVRALHVVGEDLELRLGVDLRLVREQQGLVGLLGVGLLRVGADADPAVEDAARPAVEDALVELVARRSAASRGRSPCGCRRAGGRARGRGRSACSPPPRPRAPRRRRCARGPRRARRRATRSSRSAPGGTASGRRGTPPRSRAGSGSGRRRRRRPPRSRSPRSVKYDAPSRPAKRLDEAKPGCSARRPRARGDASRRRAGGRSRGTPGARAARPTRPARTRTTAPSSKNAVLSATKGCPPGRARRARCGSSRPGARGEHAREAPGREAVAVAGCPREPRRVAAVDEDQHRAVRARHEERRDRAAVEAVRVRGGHRSGGTAATRSARRS